MTEEKKPVDHSVPYPEAPPVEHGNKNQEHYRGARDPELAKSTRESRPPRSTQKEPKTEPQE